MAEPPATIDPWSHLRRLTAARLALGHAGHGLPTRARLDFLQAESAARDAVHAPFDAEHLAAAIAGRGWPVLQVASCAPDRRTYLQRPDLGRRLSDAAIEQLSQPGPRCQIVIVVGDGLSSPAVATNALPVLDALMPLLAAGSRRTQIVVASHARVAIGDHLGELLQADIAVVLIGERPGLSACDSLGLYLTWMPRLGRMDAERNCISNVRPAGLSPADAAGQAAHLTDAMYRHEAAGVLLKSRQSRGLLGDLR